jgi:very-short-patch-repair endonuclease
MPQARGSHSAEAEEAWHKKWNGKLLPSVTLPMLAFHSSKKAYWHASCGNRCHIHFKAVDTINEKRREALLCRVCKQTKRQSSQHEHKLYRLLSKNHSHFAVEVHMEACSSYPAELLKHPFDAMLVPSGLLIEVDGEQHIDTDLKNVRVEEQQAQDATINAAVAAAGLCLVRLHYQDTRLEWWHVLQAAKARVQEGERGFVMFSKAFGV